MESEDLLHSPFFFKTNLMGGTHFLNINVPDHLTECILRIEDFSIYEPLLPYAGATLQIMVPGFNKCITFDMATTPEVQQGFVFTLNACMLELQTDNCGLKQYPLPDGIYNITYSVSPNAVIYHEVYHLRITSAQKQLRNLWGKLNLGPCSPTPEIKAKFELLQTIDSYLKAAKVFVEDEKDCDKGMALYHYAKTLLDKSFCKNC